MTHEPQKLENIIKDYGLEDGKPSEEVFNEMKTIIEKNKMNTTPQELAILEGRLKMRNLVTKEIQGAIKEAGKHTYPSPETMRMYKELRNDYNDVKKDISEIKEHIKKDDEAHKDMLEQIQKGKESWIKIDGMLTNLVNLLDSLRNDFKNEVEERKMRDEETSKILKPMAKTYDGLAFLGSSGMKFAVAISVISGLIWGWFNFFDSK